MRFELREDREGKQYYSLVYYAPITKKRVRIKKEEIRARFGSDTSEHQRAVDVCRLLETEIDSQYSRIKRKMAWEKEFLITRS